MRIFEYWKPRIREKFTTLTVFRNCKKNKQIKEKCRMCGGTGISEGEHGRTLPCICIIDKHY